jgi:phosphatidylserine decarboxylase
LFTKYGRRELLLFGGGTFLLMVAAISLSILFVPSFTLGLLISLIFILLFAWVVAFFRDPARVPPRGEHRLVAPADGMIYDIGDVDEPEFLDEPATRIGIFLSIFNCHVNRTPCSGRVDKIVYRKGKFFSALNATQCSAHNESNFIGLSNAAGTEGKVAVKQIAGRIARRIVCDLQVGDAVERGQTFGMIKFGSRTELFIPKSANFKIRVKLRDLVHAGRTIIGSLEPAGEPAEQVEVEADAVPETVEEDEAVLEYIAGSGGDDPGHDAAPGPDEDPQPEPRTETA